MVPTELAWAAGFVDGEGHVTVRKKNATWRVRGSKHTGRPRMEGTTYAVELTVTNRNPTPMRMLALLFGGDYVPSYRTGRKNTYYKWRLGSDQAVYALELMLPFLVGKRELATTAISFHHWYKSTAPKAGEGMPAERRAHAETYHQTCKALIARYRSAPGADMVKESPELRVVAGGSM